LFVKQQFGLTAAYKPSSGPPWSHCEGGFYRAPRGN